MRPSACSAASWIAGLLLALACSLAVAAPAQAQENKAAADRLALMQQTLADQKWTSQDLPPEALQFTDKPLLRYDDPTRELLDATVWRLGKNKRPTAVVTLEIYEHAGEKWLSYEFVSLSEASARLESPHNFVWDLRGTELKMAALPSEIRPSESERTRLPQMRRLAGRFYVEEFVSTGPVQCRLMPQPLARYSDESRGVQDGALFVFASGTNPELGLVIETDGQAWRYGTFRLSTATIHVRLDDKPPTEHPHVRDASKSPTYMARRHELP